MSEPLNIEISKFQRSIGNNQSIATFQQGDGVVVQLWEGEKLVYRDLMTYEEYVVYRSDVPAYGLPDYPPPENHERREAGGTNANGNTIGRVVGETARSDVPATEANPPLIPESQEEDGWWIRASPWVHGTLDALGFIPGLGAIPDIGNGIVYAIEGDISNAGISMLAAIPFAGDALKGAVLINKGAKASGAAKKTVANSLPPKHTPEVHSPKSPDTLQNKPKNKNGGKSKGRGKLEVECFELPNGANEAEFLRQLKEQEDALNSLEAEKLIERRDAIRAAGGTDKLRDKAAQARARKDYKKHRIQALRNQNKTREEAIKIVTLELEELAATHILDIIAGGDPKKVGMGHKGINSSLGAQWRGRRANSLETEAREMIKSGLSKSKMNVKLKKCK